MTYREKLEQRIAATGSNLCVGLDIRADSAGEQTKQNILQIINETLPYAAAYKPNSAYFEALGWQGIKMLTEVLREIPKEVPIVFDVKRGDIGETQGYYARAAFEELGVDAVPAADDAGDAVDVFTIAGGFDPRLERGLAHVVESEVDQLLLATRHGDGDAGDERWRRRDLEHGLQAHDLDFVVAGGAG